MNGPPLDFEHALQNENDRLRKDLERKNRLIDRMEDGGPIFNEGGTSWQKWILGILAVLVVAGVVGGIAGYGQLQAIRQQQTDAEAAALAATTASNQSAEERRRELDRRLESIERKLEQRGNAP